jgi:hypothetical protein
MVIAALVGFSVAAQFVSLVGLESPYYVVLLGAGALKLTSTHQAESEEDEEPSEAECLHEQPEAAQAWHLSHT